MRDLIEWLGAIVFILLCWPVGPWLVVCLIARLRAKPGERIF